MENIKPAEISAILLQELTGFDTRGELDTKGSVLQIGDGVARVYGIPFLILHYYLRKHPLYVRGQQIYYPL